VANSPLRSLKVFISGGAGCVGSHLVQVLLEQGAWVTAYDNLSRGKLEFLEPFIGRKDFEFVHADLLDMGRLKKAISGHDVVFHLAANSDISEGRIITDLDLRLGTQATYNVLEAMRHTGIGRIIFSSSSAIYGETNRMPTGEDAGPLFPVSFYGASKLASEGLISAFSHNFGIQTWIFRFGNVVGRNVTHGVVLDFLHKLFRNPEVLEILGNGHQTKPYLHIDDCIDGMLFGFSRSSGALNYFNLACEGATSVNRIAALIVEAMGLKSVRYVYSGGSRGWVGDVSQVSLDVSKLAKLGWRARYTSDEAVKNGIQALLSRLGYHRAQGQTSDARSGRDL
jgi:UDP-glucose 4-epimerase